MTDASGLLSLVVSRIEQLTPAIKAISLVELDGSPLPGWEAGAHINVHLPDGSERSYSLVTSPADQQNIAAPSHYRLGVRLDAQGQGGSRFMHALAVGDQVTASRPRNHFALAPSEQTITLVAGGIGITPLLSMATALHQAGRAFRLIYAVREASQAAFLDELKLLPADCIRLHCDQEEGQLDLAGLMARLQDQEPLYLCGPLPMIEAGIAQAKALAWAPDRLHFEIFTAPEAKAGDQPFDVVLASSGKRYTIPADKTILQVLIEAGEDPIYDCQRGDCGICQVGVVSGVPDHRDFILSDSEKAAGKLIQICISRAQSGELVLDL